MIELPVKLIAAYLIGGIMGGDVMRRLLGGGDLRDAGSGNVGATNALRTRGKGFALGVLAIDIGKGVFAALAIPALWWPWAGAAAWPLPHVAYACGVAVAIGHCYPLLQKFRGGKGVATLTGVYGALLPWALPWMVLGFALVLILTGYVAMASLAGAAVAVLWVAVCPATGLVSATGVFALIVAALVWFKHRGNIARLLAGTEPRMERVRVLGRRLDRWRGR